MTLAVGDHVVKIDRNTGKPMTGDSEMHVEFEVMEPPTYQYPKAAEGDYTETWETVKLRVVR